MSKSLGNFWTVRDILTKVDAMVLRFALINAHYRSPIDMNEALLNDAERNYNRLLECYVAALKAQGDGPTVHLPHPDVASPHPLARATGLLEKMGEGFARAMDDDFNSLKPLPRCWAWCEKSAKPLLLTWTSPTAKPSQRTPWTSSRKRQGALGVLPSQDVALAEPEEDPRKAAIADQVEALLVQRSEARASKDWALADSIRDQLNGLGVVVTDTTTGPEWDLA